MFLAVVLLQRQKLIVIRIAEPTKATLPVTPKRQALVVVPAVVIRIAEPILDSEALLLATHTARQNLINLIGIMSPPLASPPLVMHLLITTLQPTLASRWAVLLALSLAPFFWEPWHISLSNILGKEETMEMEMK